jgi:ribonuclease Z
VLTEVQAGPFTIRGVSVGGVYTSLLVPELSVICDAGMALRSFAGAENLFLSHAHVDHAGALLALLGIRGLIGRNLPLKIFMPKEIEAELKSVVSSWSKLHRNELLLEAFPMAPGDELHVRNDYWVRAFRTRHPVPSLGYEFIRRTKRLRAEFSALPGPEIAERRQAGENLLEDFESSEFAYATDTLVEVLDQEPRLLASRVLVLECTFLDEKKSLKDCRSGCHIHLDELLSRADRFANEKLVLMHFSQIYKPAEVVEILDKRCPPDLRRRIVPFVPRWDTWPG